MNKKEIAGAIIEALGGKENITNYTHCVTGCDSIWQMSRELILTGLKISVKSSGQQYRADSIRLSWVPRSMIIMKKQQDLWREAIQVK